MLWSTVHQRNGVVHLRVTLRLSTTSEVVTDRSVLNLRADMGDWEVVSGTMCKYLACDDWREFSLDI